MWLKILLLLVLLTPLIFTIIYFVTKPRKERELTTRRVPTEFRIVMTSEEELLLQFAEEKAIREMTARILEIADGVWEHTDRKGYVLQIRFDKASLFFPFLNERIGVYETTIPKLTAGEEG